MKLAIFILIIILSFELLFLITHKKPYFKIAYIKHKYRPEVKISEKTKPRILCIGGSTTYGVCLPPEGTYPAYLQKEIPEYEVLNLGLQAGTTYDFINLVQEFNSMKPDIVLFAPLWNDVNADLMYGRIFRQSDKIRECKIALGYYIYKLIRIIENKVNHHYYYKNQEEFKQRLETIKPKFKERLVKFLDLLECKRVYLLTFPCMVNKRWNDNAIKQLTSKHNDPEFQFLVHKYYPLCQKVDIDVINSLGKKVLDFSQMYSDYTYEVARQEFFIDVIHLSYKTNEQIADFIRKIINEDNIKISQVAIQK